MPYNEQIFIKKRKISIASPSYFIADIAANHDGDLERAKDLIYLAAEAGADAAKFQHFKANTIVSDFGFKKLGSQLSHQNNWEKSVYETYEDASLNIDWTPVLEETCQKAGIDFFTSPYSIDLIDAVDKYVPAYKIGSGDITFIEVVEHIAQKNKPVFLACGASSMEDVTRAVAAVEKYNKDIILMQCNTNYTASIENYKYINLNVLNSFKEKFPNIVLGLSDHTFGHATVLGAIALGARVIEKHFTDNNSRKGPDHKFSMNPLTWKEMVERSRELEAALGDGIKVVENNEKDTVVLQRRCLRLTRDVKAGDQLAKDDLEALRPAPEGSFEPYKLDELIGKTMLTSKPKGDAVMDKDVR
ncbi:MAG: N-acetylneuraminate synthase family protein [Alphaproteobacteria bacterium]